MYDVIRWYFIAGFICASALAIHLYFDPTSPGRKVPVKDRVTTFILALALWPVVVTVYIVMFYVGLTNAFGKKKA